MAEYEPVPSSSDTSRTPTPRPKSARSQEEQQPPPESAQMDFSPSRGFDIERLRRHVTCQRRNGVLCTDPVTLPCLHSFCSECLPEFAREQRVKEAEEEEHSSDDEEDEGYIPHANKNPVFTKGSFRCPKGCEVDTGITINDDGTLRNVPEINYSLKNVIRTFQLKDNLPIGKIRCGECKDSVAFAICNNKECANKPLCEECLTHHIRNAETKNHMIVRVNVNYQPLEPTSVSSKEINGGQLPVTVVDGGASNEKKPGLPQDPWWKNLDRSNWTCHVHPKELVDMYCKTHDVVTCFKCCLIDHRYCDFNDVDKYHDDCIGPMQVKLSEVKDLKKPFERAVHISESLVESLEFKKDKRIEEITARYNQLIDQITAHRNDLIDKTRNICNLKKGEIQKHREFLENVLGNINRSTEFIDDVVDTFIPAEFMFIKTQIENRMDELLDKYIDCDCQPSDNDEIFLRMNVNDVPQSLIGSVYSTPHVKHFKIGDNFPENNYFEAATTYSFTIQSCDIAETRVSSNRPPELKALISQLDDDRLHPPPGADNHQANIHDDAASQISELSLPDNGIRCSIRPSNRRDGTYTVMMYVPLPGRHMLFIYWPRPYPHRQYYIQDCPRVINVGPQSFPFSLLRI